MIYINKEKLNKISLNKSNFYVAIDFDKTITAKESCDSWEACGNTLGEEFKKHSYYLAQKYEPIEVDYNISFDAKNRAMEKWYYESMKLYYEYNLTISKLKDSVNNCNLIFRSGAKDFLHDMYLNNIPVIILSAGIGNVIEQFLKNNDCYYDNIYIISNFISFDEYGNMIKFKGNLIHTLNKTMEGNLTSEFSTKIKDKEFRLLLGDFIEDKKMIPISEWSQTISVGFLDKKVEENLEVYKQNFDIVLTPNDACFEIVNSLVL